MSWNLCGVLIGPLISDDIVDLVLPKKKLKHNLNEFNAITPNPILTTERLNTSRLSVCISNAEEWIRLQ